MKKLLKRKQPGNSKSTVNEKWLRLGETFQLSADIISKKLKIGNEEINYLYCESIVDKKMIAEYFIPKLNMVTNKNHQVSLQFTDWFDAEEVTEKEMSQLEEDILRGKVLVFLGINGQIHSLNFENIPTRNTEETNTATSIRGPRDGFVENIQMNIALIRKRMVSSSLAIEKFQIGKRSKTNMALLYISDVANPDTLAMIRSRITKLKIDVFSSSQQVDDLLSDNKYALLPTFDYSGRADYAVDCLNSGRFLLVFDGQPTVSIAPINFSMLFKSPEDAELNFYVVSMGRFVRFCSSIVSPLLPGFWIATMSYNIEQVPYQLVATISAARAGIPFNAPLEMLIMLLLFELFYEATIRLPLALGQSVSVLGGLILGDAAIRAGLTSPSMVVIAAITYISGFTLVNQSLRTAISFLRFYVLLLSTIFGIYGFIFAYLCMVIYTSTLTSLGTPLLSTFVAPNFKVIIANLFKLPWNQYKERMDVTAVQDKDRQGG